MLVALLRKTTHRPSGSSLGQWQTEVTGIALLRLALAMVVFPACASHTAMQVVATGLGPGIPFVFATKAMKRPSGVMSNSWRSSKIADGTEALVFTTSVSPLPRLYRRMIPRQAELLAGT